MVGTQTKRHVKMANHRRGRWIVFVRKQGEVLLVERSHAQEQYIDYNVHINGYQYRVRPERP